MPSFVPEPQLWGADRGQPSPAALAAAGPAGLAADAGRVIGLVRLGITMTKAEAAAKLGGEAAVAAAAGLPYGCVAKYVTVLEDATPLARPYSVPVAHLPADGWAGLVDVRVSKR